MNKCYRCKCIGPTSFHYSITSMVKELESILCPRCSAALLTYALQFSLITTSMLDNFQNKHTELMFEEMEKKLSA